MSYQEYKYNTEFFNLGDNNNDYRCNTFRFNKENHQLDQHFHCPKCYGKEWVSKQDGKYGKTNWCSLSYQVCPTCRYEKNDTFHKNLSVNEEFIRMIICTPNICASS